MSAINLRKKCGRRKVNMIDIYLMQQLARPYKNKFATAYEKHLMDSTAHSGEITSINEIVESYELETYISIAIQFLKKNGAEYLSKERFEKMLSSFEQMNAKLAKIDLEQELPDNMVQFFELEEALLEEIYEIGVKKFKEADYPTSLGCFVLLSSLDSTNVDYWYSEGLVAQKCAQYPLALIAYSSALELDPALIGAWLFSAQCYLAIGQSENAKLALEAGKTLNTDEQGWSELISQIQLTQTN